MKSLLIQNWLPQAPLFVRMFSEICASNAHNLYGWLNDKNEENNLAKKFTASDLKNWLGMYRSWKRLQRNLEQSSSTLDGAPSVYAKISKELESRTTAKFKRKGIRFDADDDLSLEDIERSHHDYLLKDVSNTPLTEELQQTSPNALENPMFLFMTMVAIPCLIFYRESHVSLYRKARHGDVSSLEKLLRVDKSLIRDPSINKWFHFYSYDSKNLRTFDRLTEALRNQPQRKLTRQQVKIRVAGMISVFSQEIGHRVSAPDIQKLFDSVAVDYGHYRLRDEDLPEAPEAFSQALRRERNALRKKLITPTKLS